MRLIALGIAAPFLIAADAARLTVKGAGGTIRTGESIELDVAVPARSAGGASAQPPLAWIDHEDTLTPAGADCAARADRLGQAGVIGSSAARDFNAVHVAILSDTGGLHVLDPRNGIRGARSLAHVELGGVPADWLWQPDTGLIWVALPARQEVVAIDVGRWRVAYRHAGLGAVWALTTAADGTVLALAPGRGVTRLAPARATALPDTATARAIVPGAGAALWAIEPAALALHAESAVRRFPVSLRDARWSDRADRLIAITAAGALVTIGRDGRVATLARTAATPLDRLWLGPDGDVAIAWTPGGDGLTVIDLAAGRVARMIAVDRPLALASSRSFLFVRTAGRGETMVLPIAALTKPGAGPRWIAGGDAPTGGMSAVTANDEGLAAWIAADLSGGLIYFYHEGMNIPSGTLRYPGAAANRLLLVGPLMRRAAPGRFAADFLLDRPGRYVAVAVGTQPRYVRCTPFTVTGPTLVPADERSVSIAPVDGSRRARLGEAVTLRFTMAGAAPPPTLGLLVMDVSGVGAQRHVVARRSDAGLYEAAIQFGIAGIYLVMPDPVALSARIAGRPVTTVAVTP